VSAPFDLEAFLAEARSRVAAGLSAVLPAGSEPPQSLHEAMRYAVFSGGKGLRPALAFAAARAVGASWDRALPVATAVELVHAYSLVHDDLPAMDDDVERRGRPTVHVKFGEALAILAGDALLTAAFECLAPPQVSNQLCGALVPALTRAAGSRGLVGGQVDDLALRPEAADEATLASIHARKTAALFEFALVGGALAGGGGPEAVSMLERFGRSYGLAFQLTDDLLDADRGETSILLVLPASEACARVEGHVADAKAALRGLGDEAAPLRALAENLQERIR